ncbi:hypothetical protein HAALTHF_35670n [Vreelandella aquamarina]|nr:hypothetical protein HAALTHF_35670n [Halomonas axialensis]
MNVLRSEQDFYDLAMDYFKRARSEGVLHIDMHFDPQAHLQRGVPLEVVMAGLLRAKQEAESQLDLSVGMIMAFLRDRPADEALHVLEQAAPYWKMLDAIGLDSAERDNPPEKFQALFARAKELGLVRVAHAGEGGACRLHYASPGPVGRSAHRPRRALSRKRRRRAAPQGVSNGADRVPALQCQLESG